MIADHAPSALNQHVILTDHVLSNLLKDYYHHEHDNIDNLNSALPSIQILAFLFTK